MGEPSACCEAEKETFKGAHLECERDRGHAGLHLDVDQGLWWASTDNRQVTADGFVPSTANTRAVIGT